MPTLPQTRAELEALRASLVQLNEAKARGDNAEMAKLEGLAGEIDDVLDQIAIADLNSLAIKLAEIRTRIETATQKAKSWPLGSLEALFDHERPFRDDVPDNDFEERRTERSAARGQAGPARHGADRQSRLEPELHSIVERNGGSAGLEEDRRRHREEDPCKSGPLCGGRVRQQSALVVHRRRSCPGVQPALRSAPPQRRPVDGADRAGAERAPSGRKPALPGRKAPGTRYPSNGSIR